MKGRAEIRSLEKKRDELLLWQQDLIEGRQKLLLCQSLLTAWCEALTVLQEKQGRSQHPAAADSDPDVQAHFQQLLVEEITLMGQLSFNEQLSSCSIGAPTALPDPGPGTLSPGDPVALVKQLVSQGPVPEAAALTSLDLARMLRETVLQASLQRTLQQGRVEDQSVPAGKELWDRYLHVLMSVGMLGRAHENESIAFYNLDTLRSAPENATASDQRTEALPPLLDLTPQQSHIISAGVETFDGLTALLNKQREEVVGQLEAAAAAEEGAAGADQQGGACSGAPLGSGMGLTHTLTPSDLRPLRTFQERQEHLQMQQRLAARLKLLIAKQDMLNHTLCGLVVGCLTYDQLTQSSILAWPYVVRVGCLARHIQRFRQQELEQQQPHHLRKLGRQKQLRAKALGQQQQQQPQKQQQQQRPAAAAAAAAPGCSPQQRHTVGPPAGL